MDLGWSFWALTGVGATLTVGLSIYCTKLATRLLAEEAVAEAESVRRKQQRGGVLTPKEKQLLQRQPYTPPTTTEELP